MRVIALSASCLLAGACANSHTDGYSFALRMPVTEANVTGGVLKASGLGADVKVPYTELKADWSNFTTTVNESCGGMAEGLEFKRAEFLKLHHMADYSELMSGNPKIYVAGDSGQGTKVLLGEIAGIPKGNDTVPVAISAKGTDLAPVVADVVNGKFAIVVEVPTQKTGFSAVLESYFELTSFCSY